ncbi:olfactory receptor 7D4-like [Phyllostomus discolor]|uniref:Olfactory receptor 7D4-like n=1 Tax=Phyllostomus discolor TaxID=89673 RepID=A0A7E6EAS8_9CHIR|nr:olfactory receptor 7D4-like [Phyllostomus discolor]
MYTETGNQTATSKLILLGLSEDMDLQAFLFGLLLYMYLVCVTGNLLIILAIISDSHLHTPMYFFLSNLSFVDICFTSTTILKMLVNIQTQSQDFTYEGCLTQMYFFMIFAGLDNLLLTIMAYDQFVAICYPLHYSVIMNPCLCSLLLVLPWLICLTYSLLQSLMVLRVSFCKETEILHFFCELVQILKLVVTLASNILQYFVMGLLGVIPLAGFLFSYSRIISSLMGISYVGGKYKFFSTYGSHLSVVSLFCGAGLGVYLTSGTAHPSRRGSIASVIYTVVAPMPNPFIYSLRNRNMKEALRRLFSRGAHSW